MRNNVKIVFLAVILTLIALFTVSCGEEKNYTSIETPNLEFKDGAYNLTVSSDVSLFDLTSLFVVSENANFFISDQENFENSVGFEVELKDGSNTYYLKVNDGIFESVYKFVIYRKKHCTVTFNTNGGSEVPEIVCEEGQILEAPVSLKLGYTLNWDYDFNTPINSDVTINASWTANKYKINIEGGDTSFEVNFGEVPSLVAPEKLGYNFTEWQYNGTKFDATKNYMIASDIVIQPVYEAQKYTINYVTIGGTNSNPSTYTVEDEIILSELVWEIGSADTVMHLFDGWYKDDSFTEKIEKIEIGTIGNIDLYAKWTITNIPEEKIETTITFNASGFECDGTTQTVVVGEEYVLPKLEKNGYVFNGWKSEDGVVVVQISGIWAIKKDNISLVPMWTERAYSITYVLNDGTNSEENVDTYCITDSIVLLAPTKQYSTFGGWYLDANFENKITEITEGTYGDLTIYAKWESVSVTVNYDANGGQIAQESQELILGANYALVEPQKLGYKFDGWYNGEELVLSNGIWTNEEIVNLTAKWSVETYSISYELNGGTVDGTVDSYTYESESFVLPIPVSGDRKFIGWSINDGPITMNMIVLKGSVGNRTYVAHWFDLEKDGVVYSIEDGVATVTGYKGVVGATIVIPSEFNGYKVVAIGNNAFSGYGIKLENVNTGSGFATLYIPDTITRIGANAFKDCNDLKVQISDADDEKLESWVKNVAVESGNSHVVDVIMGKRPAIGWKVYYKPEN